MDDVDRRVRHVIYETLADEGRAPSPAECAAAVEISEADAFESWRRLAAEHEIVLDGDTILMAHPFAGRPTPHVVAVGSKHWFANCAWDAFGLLALLGDGTYRTADPATGADATWRVEAGVVSPAGLVHFLVPAARFWDDIGFT